MVIAEVGDYLKNSGPRALLCLSLFVCFNINLSHRVSPCYF